MIKKIYLFLQNSTMFLIVLASLSIFVLFQKDVAPFLAKKYLNEFSIEYSSLKGTLFNGVEIEDFRYEDSMRAKKLNIKYNFFSLLRPTPRIALLEAEKVFIDLNGLLDSKKSEDSSSDFAFNISAIELKDATLIHSDESVDFDFKGSEFSYRDVVDIESVELKLDSKYGNLELRGEVCANELKAKSSLLISDETLAEYVGFLTYLPQRLAVDVDINSKEINLKTDLKSILFNDVPNLVLEDARVDFSYSIDKENFTLNTNYKAKYGEYEAAVTQSAFVDKDQKTTSDIKAKITNEKNKLPFDEFALKVDYENNVTKTLFSAKDISLNLLTQDFKNFSLDGNTIYAKFDAEILKEGDETFLQAKIYPKEEFLSYKEYNLDRFSNINMHLHQKSKNIVLSLDSDILSLTIFADKESMRGFVDLGSAHFELSSDFIDKKANIDTKIVSVDKFMQELGIKPASFFFDAQLNAQTELFFKDSVEAYSKVKAPTYTLRLDSKREYSDIDNFFEFFYKEGEVTLKKYNFGAQNRRIYSNRASKVVVNDNYNIEFREFWIYDNLLLKGLLKTSDMSADFSIKSDNFRYESKDANVTLKVDLRAQIEADGKQHVDGKLKILDGVVTYEPQKDYTITDEDIVIIQDIKEYDEKTNREVNIHVTSVRPIKYKIKNLSLTFVPNLMLYQEMGSYLQILGVVNIKDGEANLEDKIFEFDESEIYFYGGKETDPYLNLNLHYYTTDYIDIEIYVTNKASSPVVILSSKPAMSQNDILSYILFDESASSVFNTASGSSKTSLNMLLLGAGLKKALNKTTGVKFDTLNILTNKEGTLGYEVGARFNKKIRIVYRNDEISSLILQYSLSKSIRIDVDIKETGQGVSIVYIKDFSLPKP
ncbi:MAG: translocation/assembly module TamB domain-containing protein [Sulfurimonas sp.]